MFPSDREQFLLPGFASGATLACKGVRVMNNGMDRREFLKSTAAVGAAVMAGGIMGESKTAYGAVRIPEVDRL